MIGVIVPAHNEERELEQCLAAIRVAAGDEALGGEAVHVIVVLDSCSDGSRAIVGRHARADISHANHANHADGGCVVGAIAVDVRNVGAARAAGAACLLALGARWLAFTDADTRVSPAWLSAQLGLDADVVCGTIAVDDWSPHRDDAEPLRRHFHRAYTDADGHRHIHGANLGVSAAAYLRAGGFEALACGEDVALVAALERCGARFAWSSAPRVVTSARRDPKASGGFGDTLLRYAASARAILPSDSPVLAGLVE
ncbi:Glycosyl transferase family 2 [Duganella sp. CF517]|uniref:glycosyltransferase n=1 Tax=Duganella sp. CF517 TaxID=1881038 RepID=UPI0008D282C7|nr:glycosyltransferase [Duganella sp. CF517]SEO33111.1 Glycosyl transferase family 2 [Duganella sp. CF517]